MDAIKTVHHLLANGELHGAIEQVQQHLRATPGASDLRAQLVELLCLAGDLERADEVLATLAKHHPDWMPGAVNLRQLLRAQQARLALRRGQLADDVVAVRGPALEALLALNVYLGSGQLEQATSACTALEASRTRELFKVGDVLGEVRDCDDSLNGYVEGLGTDGRYYLWQWSELESLRFHPPASPLELVWRRTEFELTDGRQGEAFFPLTYAASQTDLQRLGRETDWTEHAPGIVTGVGQKLYLVGDTATTLESISLVARYQPVEAGNAI